MTLDDLDLNDAPLPNYQSLKRDDYDDDKPRKRKEPIRKKNIWDRVFNKRKIRKPNQVAVLLLKDNNSAQPMVVETRKGFFNIQGKVYHEDNDCIYQIKAGIDRIPLAIIPDWSLIPYGTKRWHDKPLLQKFAELQDHTMRGIRHAELVKMGETEKKKINPKVAIGLIIVAIVAFAILRNYV